MIILLLLLRCSVVFSSSSSSSSSSSEENFVSGIFAQKNKKKGDSVHFFITKTQKYAQKQNKEFKKEKKRIDR